MFVRSTHVLFKCALQRFLVVESMTGMPTKRSERAGHFRVACSRLSVVGDEGKKRANEKKRGRTTTRETSFLALVVPRFSPRSPFFRSSPTTETLEQANFSGKNCLLMDVPLYCGVTSQSNNPRLCREGRRVPTSTNKDSSQISKPKLKKMIVLWTHFVSLLILNKILQFTFSQPAKTAVLLRSLTNRKSSDILVNHMSQITSVLLEWSRLKDVLLVLVKTIPDILNHGKETQTAIQ